MADSEYEEFRLHFDRLPQHIRAPAKCYTLVHDITPCDDLPNFEGVLSSCVTETPFANRESIIVEEVCTGTTPETVTIAPVQAEDDASNPAKEFNQKPPERKRRKLPEIPKIHQHQKLDFKRTPSLADELSQLDIGASTCVPLVSEQRHRQFFKPHLQYRADEQSPCESDVWPGTDGDSGRDSTAHSPEGSKGSSPYNIPDTASSTPSAESLPPLTDVEATHRGLHKFTGRHSDEIDIDIGDPVYVQQEADDCWCDGINLRTQRRGIFPSAYVVDVDYDFDPDGRRVNKERYVLDFLGSVETLVNKGEQVLCSAVDRMRKTPIALPQSCILEISDQGLHVMDKCKQNDPDRFPCHDYFFALKNVTFCGFHPTEQHYLGFITKHPNEERFACHVFQGNGSTRHVAEAIGRAFQRFCRKFVELAYPIHEFYME
ncbi:JNK-interacting protein 1 isoform X1 [Daphnia magna]|uniref:JNK-interacting protein 1 n=1 Tax=Daphnia magna TaxID=35525 RepID=A0A0P5D8G0_9CRUS|nr:JNK-interacting protein 1 isoform X1 [Daphnia magna]XP_045030036.1 JNK-interacting protein 1 isoform X1 [Daphnia magna]KZS20985.1 JNK-interacting protein 1 [Daphnia magna]